MKKISVQVIHDEEAGQDIIIQKTEGSNVVDIGRVPHSKMTVTKPNGETLEI